MVRLATKKKIEAGLARKLAVTGNHRCGSLYMTRQRIDYSLQRLFQNSGSFERATKNSRFGVAFAKQTQAIAKPISKVTDF